MNDASAVLGTATTPTRQAPGTVSIGVAIAVPQPWADQIREARAATGDPQAAVIPPHVTLLPPTQVPTRSLHRIRDHLNLAARRYPAFTLALEGTGTFRPVSPVVFLRVVEGGGDCDRLQQLINQGVLHRPLHFDYHPHVTLGHGVADEPLDAVSAHMALFSARFPVTHFGLYRFDETGGGSWQVDTYVTLGADRVAAELS